MPKGVVFIFLFQGDQSMQSMPLVIFAALQGEKFTQNLQCRFGNTSLTYIVNATVIDPQTAYCTSPQWYADNNTRVNFSASTSASDCWSGTEFAYYLDPQVSQVAPLTGPRYGSFELRVQLEETVCSFAEEVGLQWSISMAYVLLARWTQETMPGRPSLHALTAAHKANLELQKQHALIVLSMVNDGMRTGLSICVLLLSATGLLQIPHVIT